MQRDACDRRAQCGAPGVARGRRRFAARGTCRGDGGYAHEQGGWRLGTRGHADGLVLRVLHDASHLLAQRHGHQGCGCGRLHGVLAPPLLVCTMLVAVAVIVWSGHRARPRLSVRARHALAAALVLMYLVGSGGFSLVLLLQPAAGPALSLACALLASASTICVCVLWARCLSDVGLSGAIVRIAIASGISACCNSFVGHCLGAAGAEVAYLALLLAGMAWPVATALARPGSPTCSCERPADARDSQERPAVRSPRRLRAFLSVMGVPLLGMAISSFAMGVQPASSLTGRSMPNIWEWSWAPSPCPRSLRSGANGPSSPSCTRSISRRLPQSRSCSARFQPALSSTSAALRPSMSSTPW